MITMIMETFFLSLNSSAPSLDFLTAATTSDRRDTNRFPLLSAPPRPHPAGPPLCNERNQLALGCLALGETLFTALTCSEGD